MPIRVSESQIEREVTCYAKQRNWITFKLAGPGDRGKPDRVYFGPKGRTIFIEFKAPGGRPTRLQLLQLERLRKHGHECHIIDDVDAGKRLFAPA